MNLINGTYECKIDAKSRVMIPVPLKKQLTLQDGFVLKRSVFERCLELHPMKEWNLTMQKVGKLNRFVKKNMDFIRLYSAGVKEVEIDTLGRLLIPKDLMTYAQIKKDVVIASMGDLLEVWDKDLYEQKLTNMEDFGDLAEDVMGGISDDDNGIS
ncbi:MAG: division/cell wall cluster transcriptional repressor MraZ [Flavobacterium sp.]|nr:MAG: division/cell wall cluster transcriptional repressor MraZ [Flavobacterium sp.]